MTDDKTSPLPSDISPILINTEMERAYLDYAMSVIVSRALPDVRDGLKPVHRRILHAMNEGGFEHNKPHRKSARVVGDVVGKYHPHSDAAVYDALVRMAQDFSMRDVLLDSQGNFGSVDGDPPAAMRYTEIRMAKIATAMLNDIDLDTVDFQPNYDGSESEPVVLPARFPNLLVNGGAGIAVGMATNIPPHNLGEVIDGTLALIDNPALEIDELIEYIPGPDFPTRGMILGRSGIQKAYTEGRGSVIMRGRATIETMTGERERIVINEIPYQVNKAKMIEQIADLVRAKRIEGISDLRDESDRDGIRVVIELKRDAVGDVVLNQLYRYTPLQTNFPINLVALNGGRPESMTVKDVLVAFIAFREEVVTRRTRYKLKKARERAHILAGLAIAVANIDEIIRLIRTASDPASAREALMSRDWPAEDVAALIQLIADPLHKLSEQNTYRLSETQARAILELRLQRLTALGRDEVANELRAIMDEIKEFLTILGSRALIQDIIRNELKEIKDTYATPRLTTIEDYVGDMEDEDLIQEEEMVVTVSHNGYIKRVPLTTYRAQRRGGKGRSGMATRDEDFVSRLFVASTHAELLFFTSAGMVYRLKTWRLPLAAPQARGKALINLLPLSADERITSILPLSRNEVDHVGKFLVFATEQGNVRRNKIDDFLNINRAGKIAMRLDEQDHIIGVTLASEDQDIFLVSAGGQAIRFAITDVRVFKGRDSVGVRGIRLADGDKLISMAMLNHMDATAEERQAYLRQAALIRRQGDEPLEVMPVSDDEESADLIELSQETYARMGARENFILTLSSRGFGKQTSSYEYRLTNRGGKGITAMATSQRNGPLIASFPVEPRDQIMLVTNAGQLIRCPVDDIRIAGRATQGVRVFNVASEEEVVSVEHIPDDGSEDDDLDSFNKNEASPLEGSTETDGDS